jgi:N-6 DNA Methylase
MSLTLLHEKLGWPSRDEILRPSGEGPRVFAELARAKIGRVLTSDDRIGVLTPNSKTSTTEPPLAIVCETQANLGEEKLRELQKLAWNFSRTPMLVTVEPQLLRAWTCCKPPSDQFLTEYLVEAVTLPDLANGLSQRAAQVLHWINLVSGQFFKENAGQFRRDQRADQMLLENLHFVRDKLRENSLTNDDVCHDLLARVVFVQFLFDRKDSLGHAALNAGKLERLYEEGVLKAKHDSFASILSNYHETYRLFYWLDERFNGDLFPGKNHTGVAREHAWQLEKRQVNQTHLGVLKDLVSGDLHLPTGQRLLWREYAFDAIPLEFISSILEAFVKDRARTSGIYYTPPHLVDFALDQVLPWGGDQWNLKVLDPACGSGVFLVKAFQRLVHRWKNAHPNEAIRAETLRGLLENNLFGVDKDRHAVRVASYNLYLAMCDEIDPRYYWTQVKFPLMRERRLIHADFFREDRIGFNTQDDARTYDLVIGNAPWGEKSLTEEAKDWAEDDEHKWPVADKGIGTMFLPKAATLAKRDGKVAMIQSASSLLFNRSGPANEFRQKFFSTFRVEQVVNLSALRFKLFKKERHARKTVAPPCMVVFSPMPPNGNRLRYASPKAFAETTEAFDIIIEPTDVKEIYSDEAARIPEIWTAFLWGNRRDWALIQDLNKLNTIEKDVPADNVRRGIVLGDRNRRLSHLKGRRILLDSQFPDGSFVRLSAGQLPSFSEPTIDSDDSIDFSAFALPQLIIKKSWRTDRKRFQARLVSAQDPAGILCTQSYVTVHLPKNQESFLEAACLSYNSILAVYFLLLTSGRFASYRPDPLVEELLRVPVPALRPGQLNRIKTAGDFDEEVRHAFDLKDAEWVLIEDLFNVTLPDFKGDSDSLGRMRTERYDDSLREPQLSKYCEYFIRVLKAGFGDDKRISATIFQETGTDTLPFRLVAFELDQTAKSSVGVETLESSGLLAELETLNNTWLKGSRNVGSIYYQRVARIYDHRSGTPTIFIVKPDARRYWTRSIGLHDADQVAVDFANWQRVASNGGKHGQ